MQKQVFKESPKLNGTICPPRSREGKKKGGGGRVGKQELKKKGGGHFRDKMRWVLGYC